MRNPILTDSQPSRYSFALVLERYRALNIENARNLPFGYFQDQVNEIKNSLIEDSPRGYIDEYLIKLKQNHPEEYSTFSAEQLLITLTDHIIPSTVANSTVLAFIFTHLVHNPSIQTKIQEEIDFVVGTGRLPTLDDRPK